jgi:hypothetical protein
MNSSPRDSLQTVRNVVVKLGTQLLSTPDARLDATFIATVAKQVAALRQRKSPSRSFRPARSARVCANSISQSARRTCPSFKPSPRSGSAG